MTRRHEERKTERQKVCLTKLQKCKRTERQTDKAQKERKTEREAKGK